MIFEIFLIVNKSYAEHCIQFLRLSTKKRNNNKITTFCENKIRTFQMPINS